MTEQIQLQIGDSVTPVKKKRKVNYINGRHVHEAIIVYLDERKEAISAGKQLPRISNYIGLSIRRISTNLAKRPNFSNYTFIDEMIADGEENCIMYLHNYNPAKTDNPFSYLTKIIWRAFVRRIEKESKHSYIRHKLMSNHSMLQNTGQFDADDQAAIETMLETLSNEKSSSIIYKYEDKIRRKKELKLEKANDQSESVPTSGS